MIRFLKFIFKTGPVTFAAIDQTENRLLVGWTVVSPTYTHDLPWNSPLPAWMKDQDQVMELSEKDFFEAFAETGTSLKQILKTTGGVTFEK